MSRIMRTIKWFREVSVLAEGEQRRSRHPEIDVEHLFLALLGIGGPVTDALAERGVTLPATREAFVGIHSHRAASLGIVAVGDAGRSIPETNARGGFVYRDGVRRMLEGAANRPDPDAALFRALVDEPSGHIREVLREFDVDADELMLAAGSAAPPERALEYRRFVPAEPAAVWALVSDPERWLEWNGFEFERVEVEETGVLRAYVRQRQLDGKSTRIEPQFRVSEYVVSRFEAPRLIQWERSFPDAGTSATQSLRVELAAQGSGTEVTVSFLSVSSGRWLLRPLARVLHPVMVRAHLRGKADNISRALRQG